MFCEKCGSQLAEGSKFCVNCGSRTDTAPADGSAMQESAAVGVDTFNPVDMEPEAPPVETTPPVQTVPPQPRSEPVQTAAPQPKASPVQTPAPQPKASPVQTAQPKQAQTAPVQPAPAQTFQQPAQPIPQVQQYTQQPTVVKPPEKVTPLPVWKYMGIMLVTGIPVIGLIMVLIWNFSSAFNRNTKNFARAVLIFWIIGLVLAIVSTIAFWSSIQMMWEFFNSNFEITP